MTTAIKHLDKMRSKALLGGGKKRIQKQHDKGKLTARERLDVLLDRGSFIELDMFVRHRSNDFGMEEIASSQMASLLVMVLLIEER